MRYLRLNDDLPRLLFIPCAGYEVRSRSSSHSGNGPRTAARPSAMLISACASRLGTAVGPLLHSVMDINTLDLELSLYKPTDGDNTEQYCHYLLQLSVKSCA